MSGDWFCSACGRNMSYFDPCHQGECTHCYCKGLAEAKFTSLITVDHPMRFEEIDGIVTALAEAGIEIGSAKIEPKNIYEVINVPNEAVAYTLKHMLRKDKVAFSILKLVLENEYVWYGDIVKAPTVAAVAKKETKNSPVYKRRIFGSLQKLELSSILVGDMTEKKCPGEEHIYRAVKKYHIAKKYLPMVAQAVNAAEKENESKKHSRKVHP